VSEKIEEIYLDYFWMPNVYVESICSYQFFDNTIPHLANELLVDNGKIFLPFIQRTLQGLVYQEEVYKHIFDITFLNIEESKKVHKLLKSTHTICPFLMENTFQKKLFQELIVCVFENKKSSDKSSTKITTEQWNAYIKKHFNSETSNDICEVRFICLQKKNNINSSISNISTDEVNEVDQTQSTIESNIDQQEIFQASNDDNNHLHSNMPPLCNKDNETESSIVETTQTNNDNIYDETSTSFDISNQKSLILPKSKNRRHDTCFNFSDHQIKYFIENVTSDANVKQYHSFSNDSTTNNSDTKKDVKRRKNDFIISLLSEIIDSKGYRVYKFDDDAKNYKLLNSKEIILYTKDRFRLSSKTIMKKQNKDKLPTSPSMKLNITKKTKINDNVSSTTTKINDNVSSTTTKRKINQINLNSPAPMLQSSKSQESGTIVLSNPVQHSFQSQSELISHTSNRKKLKKKNRFCFNKHNFDKFKHTT
jgi:hypothetical protein